jgi:hypothetical protein
MNTAPDKRQADIVRLTKSAMAAAESGQWDDVVQYYCERGELLEAMQAPIREAEALLKLDAQIRDRAMTAQALLTSLLGEATATRQRLQGFQQRLGVLSSVPESLSVEA